MSSTNRTKTHCPNGHPYSGQNLYLYERPQHNRPPYVERRCRECANRRSKEQAEAKRKVERAALAACEEEQRARDHFIAQWCREIEGKDALALPEKMMRFGEQYTARSQGEVAWDEPI